MSTTDRELAPARSADDLQTRVYCQHVEITIPMEHGYVRIDRDRGDQTVDKLAHRRPVLSAAAIQRGRPLVVGGRGGKNRRYREQAAQRTQMLFIASPREQFHTDRVAGGDVAV